MTTGMVALRDLDCDLPVDRKVLRVAGYRGDEANLVAEVKVT